MTCIAYDRTHIAVDRQLTYNEGGMKVRGRKWRRARGALLLWEGDLSAALSLARWFSDGADPQDWPDSQRGNASATLLVVRGGVIVEYGAGEAHEHEVDMENIAAWGAGGDLALGAMHRGASAAAAVETAAVFNAYCGMGVDLFTLAGELVP